MATTWGMAGIAGMAGVAGKQATMRRNVNPKDQFGRKWSTAYELVTGEATGGWTPAWGALGDPLKRTSNYLAMGRNEDGQVEPTRCVIDYDLWIQDIQQAETGWYRELNQIAIAKYSIIDPKTVAELDKDPFLTNLAGPKPFPSSDVLKRAKAGYKPFLGLAPLSAADRADLRMRTLEDLKAGPAPVELKASQTASTLPPETYPEFVKWAFEGGHAKTMTEVGKLWRDHSEALSGASPS